MTRSCSAAIPIWLLLCLATIPSGLFAVSTPAQRRNADIINLPPRNVLVNDPGTDQFPNVTQLEPSIAVSGSNIVIAWNDSAHSAENRFRTGWGIGWAFSIDGGATFTDAGGLDGRTWGGDPTLGVDRAGTFYFARFAPLAAVSGVTVHRSVDGGATFERAVAPFGLGGISDKPFVAVDTTGGAFDGTVYLTWTSAISNVLNIVMSRSTDGARTFSSPVQVSPPAFRNSQYAMPAVGPDGEVYVVWYAQDTDRVYVSRSTDGAMSIEPEQLVTNVNMPGSRDICSATSRSGLNGNIRASNPPAIAVDRSDRRSRGNVYIVYSARSGEAGSDAADVYFVRSRDGGVTWSVPLRLNDDRTTTDQWLPFIAAAPNGTVGVMWYDRRLDDQNLLIDVYMAMSTDGGETFGRNFRVTDVSFPVPDLYPVNFDPNAAAACYMGSYNFLVADATHFYLAWTDKPSHRRRETRPEYLLHEDSASEQRARLALTCTRTAV